MRTDGVQLGLRGSVLEAGGKQKIVQIDMSPFVAEQESSVN
jgi:hypothetical protein